MILGAGERAVAEGYFSEDTQPIADYGIWNKLPDLDSSLPTIPRNLQRRSTYFLREPEFPAVSQYGRRSFYYPSPSESEYGQIPGYPTNDPYPREDWSTQEINPILMREPGE